MQPNGKIIALCLRMWSFWHCFPFLLREAQCFRTKIGTISATRCLLWRLSWHTSSWPPHTSRLFGRKKISPTSSRICNNSSMRVSQLRGNIYVTNCTLFTVQIPGNRLNPDDFHYYEEAESRIWPMHKWPLLIGISYVDAIFVYTIGYTIIFEIILGSSEPRTWYIITKIRWALRKTIHMRLVFVLYTESECWNAYKFHPIKPSILYTLTEHSWTSKLCIVSSISEYIMHLDDGAFTLLLSSNRPLYDDNTVYGYLTSQISLIICTHAYAAVFIVNVGFFFGVCFYLNAFCSDHASMLQKCDALIMSEEKSMFSCTEMEIVRILRFHARLLQ